MRRRLCAIWLRVKHAAFFIAAAMGLAGCGERPHPTPLEREIWTLTVPDPYPRPPNFPEPGKPGYPDVERPKVKARAVLAVIPLGSPEAEAIRALRARGFRVDVPLRPDEYGARWLSAQKEFCQPFKCCVTDIGLDVSSGRVADVAAYDYEYDKIRFPVINSSSSPANCD